MRNWGTRLMWAATVILGVAIGLAFLAAISWSIGGLTRGDVHRRQQTIARDRTLSLPPPGATLLQAHGIDCPEVEPPLYSWSYSYAGSHDAVLKFHDRRLTRDGWRRFEHTDLPGVQYVKSYGGWDARARIGFGRREVQLIVYVTKTSPSWCD